LKGEKTETKACKWNRNTPYSEAITNPIESA